ncbi:hypothetical protein QWJ34_15695 [Saccharibacillus sp. CPCC 101409]|uniref:hypothetical protein n=1 Tax=Saccharibacillus sp. CPCC 101409 TaxID=3058041 RepID=UPI002672919D|nr:hypothetical protein [Saccharibacillus sp. CPCC 101409]MDO3411209.1 hypothetical protein [Saccharibacillus sp. CPCC 101409]
MLIYNDPSGKAYRRLIDYMIERADTFWLKGPRIKRVPQPDDAPIPEWPLLPGNGRSAQDHRYPSVRLESSQTARRPRLFFKGRSVFDERGFARRYRLYVRDA